MLGILAPWLRPRVPGTGNYYVNKPGTPVEDADSAAILY